MSNRADRREKLRQRMQNDAANRGDDFSGKMFDFSDYDDVNWYKSVKGKNEIDILPFEVTTDKDPGGAAIGDDNYKLEYYQHKQIGPKEARVLCLLETYGKPCPICEAKKEMIDAGANWKDEEVKALNPSRRCLYNIIDVNNTEKGVQLFEQSHWKFEKELFGTAEYKNPEFIIFADIEAGYTITYRGSEETFNKNKFIEAKDFDFESRDPYDEDIYNDVYPLDAMLIIPTYEEVQALFMGMEVENEEPKPKKEKKAPARKSKSTDRTTAKEGRESPRRKKAKAEPEPKQEDIPDCYQGHQYGDDWDNFPDCEGCEHFDPCADRYEENEKARKEAEAKKEEKPARRQRRR